MATGSITSLGIGSGLDLQDILDQLREVDQSVITRKETEKETLQKQINAYNSVNAKLFNIKSSALNLSLESNFLVNSVSATDEDIISATVGDGYDESSYSVDVTQKARRNSWQSTAVDSKTATMFSEPASGIPDHDTTAAIGANETLTFYYGAAGEEQQIDVDLTSGMTLSEIVDEINGSANNQDGDGNQLVKAAFVLADDGDYYIRLSAVDGGNTEDSEITVAGFDWVAADTTVAIAQGSSTMYLSVPPGTNYQEMANLINGAEDNPGITASIIDNGDSTNPYQLTLTSDDTGEDARLTLTNLDDLTEVTGAGAESLNAEFTVNGISYQRQSNTGIKDVITGVTFDLKNTGESTLNIEVDRETVKEEILDMVKGFNDLITYLNGTGSDQAADTQNEDSEADEDSESPFEGDTSANRIVYQLQTLLTNIIDVDSGYTSLADIGLEIQQNGSISIDEDDLDEAIAADPDALKALFLGDSDNEVTGLADLINNTVGDMVSSTGIASTEIDEAELKVDRLDKEIETQTERLTRKYETMAENFARLDQYINQLNAQGNALQSMINAFSDASKDN